MNRKLDVDKVLAVALTQHQTVCAVYKQALSDHSLDLRVEVKNLMENLRSALDYMAHDVYETSCQPALKRASASEPTRIYCPYGRSEPDFLSSIGSSLPGLPGSSPAAFELLRSVQPFSSGQAWLCDLCSILNEAKHTRLTPQERTESETYSVESAHGSVTIPVNNPNVRVTSAPGAVRIFGVPARFTPSGIRTAPSPELTHKHTIWVAFTFEGTGVNVITLLDQAVAGVSGIAKELYSIL